MEKVKTLTEIEIEEINKKLIVTETEKAIKLKVNFVRLDGEERYIDLWVPKSCIKYSKCGIIQIKDWFRKNKEKELHGYISLDIDF